MISAEIIADSLHPTGTSRLTTFKIRMPLARWRDMLTHRTASRNASSARAIPAKRLRASTREDNCCPKWTVNKPGMSGGEPMHPFKARIADALWSFMAFVLRAVHFGLEKLGAAKEHVNYVLDPIAHITALVTMTDEGWSNFATLRYHPAAHPDLQELGRLVDLALMTNRPQTLAFGEWHLPYADPRLPEESVGVYTKRALAQSAARCCRVSLSTPDRPGGKSTTIEDAATVAKLIGADPKHASPTEHQAMANTLTCHGQGNFGPSSGWQQYRKQIPGEANLTRYKDAEGQVIHV